MDLEKLTDKIFYYPHQRESDRPMLAYLKGSKLSLAIDAGYSEKHVDEFYHALELYGLRKPDFTVITHWHYDHTFGMHHVNGLTVAHERTNIFLRNEMEKSCNQKYLDEMKAQDVCFAREYEGNLKLNIVLSDIQFEDSVCFNLGELTAKVFHTDSPHSEDTVCIYVPEEQVLFLGDSTSEDFFNDGYMDRNKLNKLVEVIREIDCRYCILSHTEPLLKEDLLEYLEKVVKI